MMTASAHPFDQPRGRRLRGLRKGSASLSATLGASDYFTGKDASNSSGGDAFKVPNSCPVRQGLLEQYNRMFNTWVAQEGEGDKELDFADFEILAQIEEAHQKLLRHQQSCPTCGQPR